MGAGLRERRRPAQPARTALNASRRLLNPARIAYAQAGAGCEFGHCKAWLKPTRSICCTATRAQPDRRCSGCCNETANSRFKLLMMALRDVATNHPDSSLQCFERVDSSRPASPRACLTDASTQPCIRIADWAFRIHSSSRGSQ